MLPGARRVWFYSSTYRAYFSDNATNPANLCPTRLTQDYARSFWTMKTGTARVFLSLGRPTGREPPDASFEALPDKTESNEKKNECVFIGS